MNENGMNTRRRGMKAETQVSIALGVAGGLLLAKGFEMAVMWAVAKGASAEQEKVT